MAVKDLQARQGNVDLVLEIVEKGDVELLRDDVIVQEYLGI